MLSIIFYTKDIYFHTMLRTSTGLKAYPGLLHNLCIAHKGKNNTTTLRGLKTDSDLPISFQFNIIVSKIDICAVNSFTVCSNCQNH